MHGPLCSFCIINYCQIKRLKTAQQNEREEGGCGPRGKAVSGMRGCTKIGLWGSGLKQEAGRAVHGGGQGHGLYGRSKHAPEGVLHWGSTSTHPALWAEVVRAQEKVG